MQNFIGNYFKNLKNKRIMFCGLGRSNLPVIEIFADVAEKIIVCDNKNESEFGNELLELKKKDNVEFRFGQNSMNNLDVDIIFRTPGMNFFLPKLIEARNNGIVVTSEMEIFFDVCPCKIFGITGSDGKTTTTTIIFEILKRAFKNVYVGGNIGNSLLPLINKIKNDDVVVVELSSFQLISMRRSPNVAIVTNVSLNHLDVHKNFSEYTEAKKNILLHQNAFGKAILNYDNSITQKFADSVRGKLLFFSAKAQLETGVFLDGDEIIYSLNNCCRTVLNKNKIKLVGIHNLENYLAAIAAVADDVSNENIIDVAENFAGVEHRIEFVRKIHGVSYYNDSIATSPTRVIKGALNLFEKNIILIAGGYDKNFSFDEFGDHVSKKVKIMILLGKVSDKIEKAVLNSKFYNKNNIIILKENSLDDAVKVAKKFAIYGDVVLLSPACASYDSYKNFEFRGNHFKTIVNGLN